MFFRFLCLPVLFFLTWLAMWTQFSHHRISLDWVRELMKTINILMRILSIFISFAIDVLTNSWIRSQLRWKLWSYLRLDDVLLVFFKSVIPNRIYFINHYLDLTNTRLLLLLLFCIIQTYQFLCNSCNFNFL